MRFENELISIAKKAILDTLGAEKKDGGKINTVTKIELGGKIQQLALIGYVSHEIEDGSCIALLNPDTELLDVIEPNVGYSTTILKEIIAQKCDSMVQIWLDAYKEDGL